MVMSAAQVTAELARKKSLGIAPTSQANVAQYNKLPVTPMSASAAAAGTKPATNGVPGPMASTGGVAGPAASTFPGTVVKPAGTGTTALQLPSGGWMPPQTQQATPSTAATQTLSSGGAMPTYNEQSTTNYGGKTNPLNEILYSKKQYDAGNQAWAAGNAQKYYGQLDPTEAAAVKGMNTQQLIDYINSKNTPQTNNNVGVTDQGAYYPQITPDQIAQDASYQINKERSDLQTAANLQSSNLRDNAAYANQLINDSRTLGDFTRTQSVNPFANMGKRTFDEGLIGRQRSIDDSARASQLTNELNAIQADLYNFDKLAPDKQRSLINEMTRIERDYGLQVGQLMGEFNGQQTLGGKAQTLAESQFTWNKDPSNPQNQGQILSNQGQQIANQFSQLQLENYPETVKQQAQLFEQQLKSGQIDIDTATYQLSQLKDPNSLTNRALKADTLIRELEAANLPERQRLELQQIRKTIANIGKVAPTSDYDRQMQDIRLKTAMVEYDNLINQSRTPPKSTLTAKESTDNYNTIFDDIDSGATKEEARMLLQQNSANLTDTDYKKLNDYINNNY